MSEGLTSPLESEYVQVSAHHSTKDLSALYSSDQRILHGKPQSSSYVHLRASWRHSSASTVALNTREAISAYGDNRTSFTGSERTVVSAPSQQMIVLDDFADTSEENCSSSSHTPRNSYSSYLGSEILDCPKRLLTCSSNFVFLESLDNIEGASVYANAPSPQRAIHNHMINTNSTTNCDSQSTNKHLLHKITEEHRIDDVVNSLEGKTQSKLNNVRLDEMNVERPLVDTTSQNLSLQILDQSVMPLILTESPLCDLHRINDGSAKSSASPSCVSSTIDEQGLQIFRSTTDEQKMWTHEGVHISQNSPEITRPIRHSPSLSEHLAHLVGLSDIHDSMHDTMNPTRERTNIVREDYTAEVNNDLKLPFMLYKVQEKSAHDVPKEWDSNNDLNRFQKPLTQGPFAMNLRDYSLNSPFAANHATHSYRLDISSSAESLEQSSSRSPYVVSPDNYRRLIDSPRSKEQDYAFQEPLSLETTNSTSLSRYRLEPSTNNPNGHPSSKPGVSRTLMPPPNAHYLPYYLQNAAETDPNLLRNSSDSSAILAILEKAYPRDSGSQTGTYSSLQFLFLMILGLIVPPIYFVLSAGIFDTICSDRQFYGGIYYYGDSGASLLGMEFSPGQKRISLAIGIFWLLSILSMIGVGIGLSVSSA